MSVDLRFDLNYVGCEQECVGAHLSALQDEFDLNYVGCELASHDARRRKDVAFDLNYVGCEPSWTSGISQRFFLFDLNYVGCERIAGAAKRSIAVAQV